MKRGNLGLLSRLALAAGTFLVGTAYAGNFPAQGTADAPGIEVVTQGALQTYANQLTNIIENRMRQGRERGANAGDPLTGFAAWASGQYDHLSNDLSSTAYDGHITFATAGFDTTIDDYNAVIGLAINYESQNFTTAFNLGTQDANGWAIMPYMAFSICDDWTLTLLAGYEWLDYTLARTEPFSTTNITGEPSADRYFGAAELIFQRYCGPWDLSAQAALLYLNESDGGFTEEGIGLTQGIFHPKNEFYLGRFKLGGQVGYDWCDMFEPYVRAALLWDFEQTDINVSAIQAVPSNSDTAGLFGIGLNIFSSDNVLFNVDFFTEQFRDDVDHWGFMGSFRVLL